MQRSQISWIKDGDKSISFFHAATLNRRRKNRAIAIRIEAGAWKEDPEEIRVIFIDYFKHIFNSSNPDAMLEEFELISVLVTKEENENISKPPSMEEIKEVIFSMNPLKAPSLEGLLILFYQKC